MVGSLSGRQGDPPWLAHRVTSNTALTPSRIGQRDRRRTRSSFRSRGRNGDSRLRPLLIERTHGALDLLESKWTVDVVLPLARVIRRHACLVDNAPGLSLDEWAVAHKDELASSTRAWRQHRQHDCRRCRDRAPRGDRSVRTPLYWIFRATVPRRKGATRLHAARSRSCRSARQRAPRRQRCQIRHQVRVGMRVQAGLRQVRGSPVSPLQVLEHRDVQRLLGDDLLQTAVLPAPAPSRASSDGSVSPPISITFPNRPIAAYVVSARPKGATSPSSIRTSSSVRTTSRCAGGQ